jgi:hypothetical protein
MRVLTLPELMRLTRTELCGLKSQITATLSDEPEGSAERTVAERNLRNIACWPGTISRRNRTAKRIPPAQVGRILRLAVRPADAFSSSRSSCPPSAPSTI